MVDHYTHATRRAGRKAIEALPELVSLRATGTDDASACAQLAHEVSDDGRVCPTMSASRYDERRWGGRAVEGAGLENR